MEEGSLEGRKWSMRVQEVKKGFPKTMVFIWSLKDGRACHNCKTQEITLFFFFSPVYSPLCSYLFSTWNRVRLPFFLKSKNSLLFLLWSWNSKNLWPGSCLTSLDSSLIPQLSWLGLLLFFYYQVDSNLSGLSFNVTFLGNLSCQCNCLFWPCQNTLYFPWISIYQILVWFLNFLIQYTLP